MSIGIGRRQFISALGGATVVWPLAARGQQERMRRLGVLVTALESDAEFLIWRKAFVQRLQELGWVEGRNLIIDYRFGALSVNRTPDFAKELIALQPDVILAGGTIAVAALRQSTFSIPIVFAQVPDPIEIGLVTSVAHPGGNVTGFTNFEPTIAEKWLQMLKNISPGISRVAIIFDPNNPSWVVYVRALEAAAPALGVRLTPAGVHDAAEIEHTMEAFAPKGGAGLIALPGPVTINNREEMITLAGRYQLPAVYPYRFFTRSGGLLSYGVDVADLYGRAASYIDRILKGDKPADLPVQAPTKYELAINLKTAKALGLTIPESLLATADDVIQ